MVEEGGSGVRPQLKIRIGGLLDNQPLFPYTYEEQFVIRFPPSVALQLKEEIRETAQPEDLNIQFTDARKANVSFHGRRFTGLLLDLPTILETHKTFDKSQYYKIADISQILLVLPEGGEETALKVKEYETNGWQFADGLTPPMKNVRNRRFKHTSASYGRQREMEAIEKKVQALLDKDTKAISSTFSIYDSTGRAILSGGGADGKIVRLKPGEGGQLEMIPEVEPSVSMEGEESNEEDEEFAAELEEEMLAEETASTQGTEYTAKIESVTTELPSTPTTMESLMMHTAHSPAIMELQRKINERKAQLASVSNPLIRARLEDVIKELEQALEERIKQSIL